MAEEKQATHDEDTVVDDQAQVDAQSVEDEPSSDDLNSQTSDAVEDESSDDESSTGDTSSEEDTSSEIDELRQQLNDSEDKFLRVQAEMQNMQTRLAKEQAQALKYANQKLGLAVLPALDNLERALQVEADDEAAEQLQKGVQMVFDTLQKALADNGIKEVGKAGEAFDPNFAQAIQSVPADDDHPADTIAEVMQKGYMLEDRVIRPAMVAVYN